MFAEFDKTYKNDRKNLHKTYTKYTQNLAKTWEFLVYLYIFFYVVDSRMRVVGSTE